VDPNLNVYNKPDVVTLFARATELMPPERYVFGKYLRNGMDVLDVGVGGGRTTTFLAPRARQYLGTDYAAAMVAACRAKFPGVAFAEMDATDMAVIPDESFDFVLFSFNGIDYIPTDAGRLACLNELRRVTRKGGVVVVSSHNARTLGIYPQLAGVGLAHKLWRLIRSAVLTPRVALRTLSSNTFAKGRGFIIDPVHGGLRTHVSTPGSIASDAAAAGLEILEIVPGHYPRRVPEFLNPWNTYVLVRARG